VAGEKIWKRRSVAWILSQLIEIIQNGQIKAWNGLDFQGLNLDPLGRKLGESLPNGAEAPAREFSAHSQ
jgi:hypothetical protein